MATQKIRVNGHVRAREAGRLSVHTSEARRGGEDARASVSSPRRPDRSSELLLSVYLLARFSPEAGGGEGSELRTREAVGCRVYIRGRFASASSRRTRAARACQFYWISSGRLSPRSARLGSNPGLSFRDRPGRQRCLPAPAGGTNTQVARGVTLRATCLSRPGCCLGSRAAILQRPVASLSV